MRLEVVEPGGLYGEQGTRRVRMWSPVPGQLTVRVVCDDDVRW
ncbi:hypothetical protein AB0N23_15690 [Streptomyces sp. NPDC052644]